MNSICLAVGGSLSALCLASALAAQEPGPAPAPEGADRFRFFDMLDQNKDGKITKDEIPEKAKNRLLPLFERLGKEELTRDEFSKLPAPQGPLFGGGRDPEEMFRKLDKNQDGVLTRDEIPEEAKRFLGPLFEKSGKESLSKDDLKRMAERFRAGAERPGGGAGQFGGFGPRPDSRPTPPILPRLMEKLDTDHDRRISRDELARIVDKFDEFDTNKDGTLDFRELLGPPPIEDRRPPGEGERGPRPDTDRPRAPEGAPPEKPDRPRDDAQVDRPARALERFKQFDTNGDGMISKDEAPEKLKQRFSDFDQNNDGQINADELREGFKKRRDK